LAKAERPGIGLDSENEAGEFATTDGLGIEFNVNWGEISSIIWK